MKLKIDFGITDRFFNLLLRLIKTIENRKRRFQVRLFTMQRVYKEDKKDFDIKVLFTITDSEGGVIPGAGLPAGFVFTVISDNPNAFSVEQDVSDQSVFHCHVGSVNPDGSDSNARVTGTLADPDGAVVATDVEVIQVTLGDPSKVSGFTLQFPEDSTAPTPVV